MAKCKVTFPWHKDPCGNDAEFISPDGVLACWDCEDVLRELEREARGRDDDDMYFETVGHQY